MTELTEQIANQRQILVNRIVVAEDVLEGIADPEWRNFKGSRAKGLLIDDELLESDLSTWLKNLDRVGTIRLKLRIQIPQYLRSLALFDRKVRFNANPNFQLEPLYTGEMKDYSHLIDHSKLKACLEVTPALKLPVEEFILSQSGRRILTQIATFEPINQQDANDFDNELVGTIFEEISYHYFKPMLADTGLILLSPDEVLTLYRHLYPNWRVVNDGNHNLTYGIIGTTVPDGLIIRETDHALVVEGTVEYKSSRIFDQQNHRIINQYQNLKGQKLAIDFFGGQNLDSEFLGSLLHHINPTLADKKVEVNKQAEPIYFLPENSLFKLPNIHPEYLPINTRAFSFLIDILILLVKSS